MHSTTPHRLLTATALALGSVPAWAVDAPRQGLNTAAIGLFLGFVLITLGITWWAARRTRTASDFYAAGGQITGLQNGFAIAGDFMSAGAFLGLAGLVFANGFDGLVYAVGYTTGLPIVVFLLASRLRNLGRYTFADVVSYRLGQKPVRIFSACASLVVVVLYLIAQMVGAGQLIKLLFLLDYLYAEVLVGALMICYVMFGGMVATTWVQIIKAGLLLTGGTLVALLVMAAFGFDFGALLTRAVQVHPKGAAILAPQFLAKDPISGISLGLALMFGTAGLPHILMRFFTVPDAKQARKSVLWATTWIGYFYVLIFIIGFGAITLVLTNPEFADTAKGIIKGGGGSANMAAVLVAKAVGGNIFYGFISAVAFATILAVVAGLTLSGASAVSHDLYATVIKKGNATSANELKVSRMTTVVLGIVAVILGIVFEKQNIAFMVSLAFAIAASANFPVLFMSVLWKDCTTRGATIGGFIGLITAVALTVLSKSVWVDVFHNPKEIFPYTSPALFSMTAGFVSIWLFSILDRSDRARIDRAGYEAQRVRSETGIGASGASGH